jgi:uncharacterized protein YcbX
MPTVVALYRYPVKGLMPETCDELSVRDDGRIEGDRVLGFRFANTPEPDDEWSSKHGMLALVNTPALARLRLKYDHDARRLSIRVDGALLANEALDEDGRGRLCSALADYVLFHPDGPLAGHAERLPLRLVGDGKTPRYHDRPPGFVTLHSRESLHALAYALADPDLNEQRFRSNVAIEGVEPWEEQTWVGRELRIGEARFRVEAPLVRCLATHANPETGERDRAVMTTLTSAFNQDQPTFAVALVPLGASNIRLGDNVSFD